MRGAKHARCDVSEYAFAQVHKRTAAADWSAECDETRPICKKCAKSRRPCLHSHASLSIHVENRYASGRIKRPRGPRSSFTAAPITVASSVPQPLEVDLQTKALMCYLNSQTRQDAPDFLRSLSDLVPACKSRMQSPVLDLAISCMALAKFSRTQGHRPAALEASGQYQRLLPVAQSTVLALDERNIDACLLVIFLMARYEDTMHDSTGRHVNAQLRSSLKSFSHHDGALAVLKLWKFRFGRTRPATDIIKHTRRGLIRSALLRKLSIPEWAADGSLFGEHDLELEYDRLVVRLANLRHSLAALVRRETATQTAAPEVDLDARELNDEARDIDEALQDWAARLPKAWTARCHTIEIEEPNSPPMGSFDSSTVRRYPSLVHATFWSHYSATRMLVNSTRLKALELVNPTWYHATAEEQSECVSRIRVMADNLASSLPCCLGKRHGMDHSSSIYHRVAPIDTKEAPKPDWATLMIWPLNIASSIESVDFEQKAWFRAELVALGRAIGVGVFECPESDQWFRL